jgi:5-oxoprolinase (ATP-hydrolysing)
VPPAAGVLSALGIGLADTTVMREQSVVTRLEQAALGRLAEVADNLEEAARAELLEEGVPAARIRVIRRAQLRYDGTDTLITVDLSDLETMVEAFQNAHRAMYSFVMDRPLIVEAVSVEAAGLTDQPDLSGLSTATGGHSCEPVELVSLYTGEVWRQAPLYRREGLQPGHTVTGPAIITEANSTTVVDPGWQAALAPAGHLLLERIRATTDAGGVGTQADPVMLEIFNNLFMSIAEQMGTRLEATAQSVNIRERLDFSCALFDPDGNLVANAPHIPVHLGSMGASVKEVIRRQAGRIRPGNVYAVNDPYHGGTHLPDITVITPVFDQFGIELFL